MDSNKSYIDSLPPKVAFFLGSISTVLVLGTLGFIGLGSCLLAGKCGAGIAAAQQVAAAPTPSAAAAPDAAQPSGPIPPLTAQDHLRGNKNAPLTIVEYSDFQCPFCSRFHPTMLQVMKDYPSQVKWVYRDFPLSFHPNAQPAAIAAECAAAQNKFWEFADVMFAQQDANLEGDAATAETFFTNTAKNLGLNMNSFANCRKDPKTLALVQADQQGGSAAGVNGTPGSFLIAKDGSVQSILGAQPYATVKAMIDADLAK